MKNIYNQILQKPLNFANFVSDEDSQIKYLQKFEFYIDSNNNTSRFAKLGTCKNGSNLRKKYTSGPRYWNVPVLVNTGTFLVYQYCLKM